MRKLLKIVAWVAGALALAVAGLAAYLFATAVVPPKPVAVQQIAAADPGHPAIPVTIWYPTDADPGFILLGSTGLRVATGGAVLGGRLPLVVLSHGTGGSAMSHADTAIALAARGFVVASLTHPGDNLQDSTNVGRPDWLANRARHISRAVDAMLGNWKDRARLDPARIGVFGFSAGASGALVALGGAPDLAKVASQCAAHPEFVCQLMAPESFAGLAPMEGRRDDRLKAAVLAAPGLGFVFAPDGLAEVRASVQLWAGAADRTVPFATNTGLVRDLLPQQSGLHVVPEATHISFLMPCGLIGPPDLCRDPEGFDRARFHEDFNRSVADFFAARL